MNFDLHSWSRVRLIAHGALREAMRQRLFGAFLVFALALAAGARWFREFNFGASELKFIADCGLGAMYVFGAALAIAAPAQFFLGEIESRAIAAVLAKPVGRDQYLAGKLAGTLALVAVFCALLAGLLAAILWWREGELLREVPAAFPQGRSLNYAHLALASFLQWLKLAVLAAFAMLIASFARSQLFVIVTTFFVLVICHLQGVARDVYGQSSAAAGRFLGMGLRIFVPDFQVFSSVDPISRVGLSGSDVFRVTTYGLAYVAVATVLAAYSFRRREI